MPGLTTRRLALEIGIAGVLLTALGWVAFGSHITHGGFYYDDWLVAAQVLYHPHGPFDLLVPSSVDPGNRPLYLVYLSVVHDVLGLHQHAFVAFTVATAIGVSLVLFIALRLTGMASVSSGMIAGLVLLFPYADATHLWFDATNSDVAITLYLLGVIVALRGLTYRRNTAIATHAGALALYAASIMVYESTATVVLATGLLYWWRGGRRAALPRWGSDIVLTLALLLIFARKTKLPRLHGLSAISGHAQLIYEQLLTLLTHTVFPFRASQTLILVLIVLLLLGASELSRHIPPKDPARSQLRRWLGIVVASLVMTAVAGSIYAPAVIYYSPLTLGIGNRVNALPAIGLILASYGLYVIIGTVAVYGFKAIGKSKKATNPRSALTIATALACLTGLQFMHLVHVDVDAYDLASAYQLQTLDRVHSHLPTLPRGDTLFLFGEPAYTAPGVPAFASTWDLNGAIQLTYHDPSLNAYPVIPGSSLTCTPVGISLTVNAALFDSVPAYGKAILIDSANGRVDKPLTQAECRSMLAAFVPGPLSILPGPEV